jgi:hypothetical protein
VALKKGPETPVQKVMAKEILYCFDDEDVDEAYKNMADIKRSDVCPSSTGGSV